MVQQSSKRVKLEKLEMRVWIRSQGAEAEVLEPPELLAEMTEQAKRMAERYQVATG